MRAADVALCYRAIVAIPACNEAERIADCLASLAVQHDGAGSPLPSHVFAVLVLANNCRDETAAVVRELVGLMPFRLVLVEETLPPHRSNAGWARKLAMDRAADLLDRPDGVILTTDADSCVDGTWVSATLAAIDRGVDAVAGYIEAQPRELIRLGPAFLQRGRVEDTYLALLAEIVGLCDPLPHDPWPNHRVASGASLAVTLAAYRAIGGLPPEPIGEDAALRAALLDNGFTIRHAVDVSVVTSCRFDGRAPGGAADTMRFRHAHPEAYCDSDMEPARRAVRRALWKGRWRRLHSGERGRDFLRSCHRFGLHPSAMTRLAEQHRYFEPFWRAIAADSPVLARAKPLRPSDLPREIAIARRLLRRLREAGMRHRAAGPLEVRQNPVADLLPPPPRTDRFSQLAFVEG